MHNDKLTFELYNPCGLFNQVASLENAVALSYAFKRDLILHNILNPVEPHAWFSKNRQGMFTKNYEYNDRSGLTNKDRTPKITDLITFKPYADLALFDDLIQPSDKLTFLRDIYVNSSDNVENEKYFSVSRRKLINPVGENIDCRVTIGWYSTFFMNRTPDIDLGLSTVRFKPEYYELAKRIADSIGDFVGAHIRLTDNQFGYPLENEVREGISSLLNYPVVIATDHPAHPTVMAQKGLILEKYIEQNFYNDFKQMEFTDEATLGLVCNLVMHHAKDFIGSQGSTFTGYIQRHVCNDMKLFGEIPYKQNGPFTWNGYEIPKVTLDPQWHNGKTEWEDPRTVTWWREWPEAKLQIG